jgi:hypothetical protein
MSQEPSGDRRGADIANVLSDLRVSVARIEAVQFANADTMKRLESKLDLGVFREEYERRHKELAGVVTTVADDYQRRVGRDQVWRIVYGIGIVLLSAGVTALALHWIK